MKIFLFIFSLFLLVSCKNTVINPEKEEKEKIPEVLKIQEEEEEEEEEEEIATISNTTEINERVYSELSLQAITEETISGYNLKLEEVLAKNQKYTRYRISYKNGDISLSGIINIPLGNGPFPLLVLNHGYIDTRYYTNGRGLKREQDYFANNGFAVIHPDYRNHAYSDKVDEDPYDFRLGYTRDVIASILAVQDSQLPELQSIDSSKVGMLGHSMGGGISQNISVSKPDLIDAVVLYGPVSNDEYTNFSKFQIGNNARSTRVEQVLQDYKTPQENPDFWAGVSSKTFFKNIVVPVMIFTGTSDKDTPTEWAESIAKDLREKGKQVEIVSYEGEGHEFGPKWSDFMKQSGGFFKENLK